MVNNDLIVSMTSWKKRITNIPEVISSILSQTMKPFKIVLNLSSMEFQQKEYDLPKEVDSFIKEKNVELYWVDGENTKQWKKFIPTMLRYPDKWVVCIDDDRIYSKDFIEILWKKHLEYPNNPITTNGGYKVNGNLQHCGCGTLECAKFYNNFQDVDINEIRKQTDSSDTVYTFLLNKNDYPLIYSGSCKYYKPYNEFEPLSKTAGTSTVKKHLEIWDWLSKKYGEVKTTPKNTVPKEAIVNLMYGDLHVVNNKKNSFKKRVVVRKYKN